MSDDDLIRRGDVLALQDRFMGVVCVGKIAALPAVTPGVKVKPLVWETLAEQRRSLMYRAHGCHGLVYEIFGDGAWFVVYGPGGTRLSGALPTLESAKAAAQADYEARIRAALNLTPQPAPDVAGLVEAAKAHFDARRLVDDTPEFCALVAALAAMEGKP